MSEIDKLNDELALAHKQIVYLNQKIKELSENVHVKEYDRAHAVEILKLYVANTLELIKRYKEDRQDYIETVFVRKLRQFLSPSMFAAYSVLNILDTEQDYSKEIAEYRDFITAAIKERENGTEEI